MAELDIDELARRLAANAGISWEMLGNYPGYAKNVWRDEAQVILRALDRASELRTADRRSTSSGRTLAL